MMYKEWDEDTSSSDTLSQVNNSGITLSTPDTQMLVRSISQTGGSLNTGSIDQHRNSVGYTRKDGSLAVGFQHERVTQTSITFTVNGGCRDDDDDDF